MRTLDIPQANDLDTVRAAVHAVSKGADSLEALEAFTQYSRRHAHYRAQAARVLGFLRVEEERYELTRLGERLLGTPLRSDAERGVYFDAMNRSRALQVIVPDLLGARSPAIEDLTDRLVAMSGLARSTAARRAGGLLAWRRRVLDLAVDNSDAEPEPEPGQLGVQLDLFT